MLTKYYIIVYNNIKIIIILKRCGVLKKYTSPKIETVKYVLSEDISLSGAGGNDDYGWGDIWE